jgi:hypothetical protein
MNHRRSWDFQDSAATPPQGTPMVDRAPGSVPPPGAPVPGAAQPAGIGTPPPGGLPPVLPAADPPPFSEVARRRPVGQRLRSRLSGRRPLVLALVLVLLATVVGLGAYWFQPWRIATDRVVQDAVPQVPAGDGAAVDDQQGAAGDSPPREPNGGPAAGADPSAEPSAEPSADPSGEPSTAPSEPAEEPVAGGTEPRQPAGADAGAASDSSGNRLLAEGKLVTQEHDTSGTVQIVELGDGRRQLVLRDLDTSDVPDLYVRLSDQPVVAGSSGWRAFSKGDYVDVAPLKGNQGDQVYTLGSSVDVNKLTSLSIWCRRFSISFGAAELGRA